MENASKALIIAGAILIAILLISVGIMVMNSMNKPIDEAASEADSQAVRIFNAKFDSYLGDGQSASTAKQVISIVESTPDVTCATKVEDIVKGHKYKIAASFNSEGKIYLITITDNNATSTETSGT